MGLSGGVGLSGGLEVGLSVVPCVVLSGGRGGVLTGGYGVVLNGDRKGVLTGGYGVALNGDHGGALSGDPGVVLNRDPGVVLNGVVVLIEGVASRIGRCGKVHHSTYNMGAACGFWMVSEVAIRQSFLLPVGRGNWGNAQV